MKKLVLITVVIFASSSVMAQIKLVKGSIDKLANEKTINLEFTYEDMKVGKKKEAEYVKQKTEDYNKKEAGKGDTWASNWVEDRVTRYQPKFRELYAEYSGMSTVDKNATYTLIVATTVTEPGYNIGISRKDAYINCTATFVETSNPSKIVAEFTLNNMPGRTGGGYDFDTGQRIEEAYAKAGKELAQYMAKLNKKKKK